MTNEMKSNNFSKNLRRLRRQSGLSQRELAKKLNVAQNTVSNWENGIREPDLNTMRMLADLLDTTIDHLLGRETEMYQADEDLDEILEALHKRPEMKTLFSISKKATREDIETAMKIIEALKEDSE